MAAEPTHHQEAQPEVDVSTGTFITIAKKNLQSVVYNLLRLTASNNGLGIRPERLGQLCGMFKRFYAHIEGSGVGLYRAKRIIENAGGTTFTVALPQPVFRLA